MRLLIVGAGAAGTAAAWRASQNTAAAEITVIHDRAGATALASGACDLNGWGDPLESSAALSSEVHGAVRDLGCWKVGTGPMLLVSASGQPRWARAADAALLDLVPLAGSRIGVTDLGRLGYDAKAWAAALNESRWARETRTSFEAVRGCDPAPTAVRANDYDFAALHDDEAQVRALGDALSGAKRDFRAWLLPPSLGINERVRDKLEQRLAMAVGECASQPGGPAGARFELARDALCTRRGIAMLRGQVTRLSATDAGWSARWSDGENVQSFTADRVILACGGIVSGGLRMGQPRIDAPGSHCFELSVGLQAPLAVGTRRLDQVGSLHGADFSQSGLSLLEKIGVIAPDTRVEGLAGLFAAGDVVANGPRSILGALQAGCLAAITALAG